MPRRNLKRDMFEHKRERVATAVANLEILASTDFGARMTVVARVATKFDVNPSWLLGVTPSAATPDGCATWAANNLRKLVAEEAELKQLQSEQLRQMDVWFDELRSQCKKFKLKQAVSPAKDRGLEIAARTFAEWQRS